MAAAVAAQPQPPREALRQLLRAHPRVHPGSAAAAEFCAAGLGALPCMEWDEDSRGEGASRPWGRLLESPARQSPLPPSGAPGGPTEPAPGEPPRLVPPPGGGAGTPEDQEATPSSAASPGSGGRRPAGGAAPHRQQAHAAAPAGPEPAEAPRAESGADGQPEEDHFLAARRHRWAAGLRRG
ncbi:unnamed protein product [Prorocentrum cordatum]|uniref:Uncharacterized protein n=1 Tax=Prorocentrum cordatum TaxID=2364126 RepID=A0ABN9RUK1_9DINO|nr:unnamed protein product [Polarella glacialis]